MSSSGDEIEDELLVLRCQGGERVAIDELVERWHPRLVRHARRLCADRDAARDAVQDAWLGIVRGLSGLDDPASFRAWAYRIVARRCADWARQRKTSTNPVEDASVEANADTDDRDQVHVALQRLPADQRLLLALRYVDDLGIADIARILGVPRGTVKSRLFQARHELRRHLESDDG